MTESSLESYEDMLEKTGAVVVPDEAMVRASQRELWLFDLFVQSFSILGKNTVQIQRDDLLYQTRITVVRQA